MKKVKIEVVIKIFVIGLMDYFTNPYNSPQLNHQRGEGVRMTKRFRLCF